jgi:1-acyl-sn-glycerol-3-phosphate acyltransferase
MAVVFPRISDVRRLRLKQCWSRQILQVLAIRVDATGEAFPSGSLLVANHISWLDILAVNAVAAVAFVSKAEVRQWLLLGWIAEKAETVFLRRGSRGHAKIVNAEIDALLNAGKSVAIFPEGTTTDGTHLLGFHAALLQPAVETGQTIQPLAISYHYADGSRSLAPAYVGETSLLQTFAAILASRSMIVRVCATAALSPENRSRRELASAAHQAIAAQLEFIPQ